jgi:hypothetical protein
MVMGSLVINGAVSVTTPLLRFLRGLVLGIMRTLKGFRCFGRRDYLLCWND